MFYPVTFCDTGGCNFVRNFNNNKELRDVSLG